MADVVDEQSSSYRFMDHIDHEKLSALGFELVRHHHGESSGKTKIVLLDRRHPERHPLCVDFLSPPLARRQKLARSGEGRLAKALGLRTLKAKAEEKGRRSLYVFDGTAGLGIDAFVMASLGCQVRAAERSPVLFSLLSDGCRRMKIEADENTSVRRRTRLLDVCSLLSFEWGDSRDILRSWQPEPKPDIVYLDPMLSEDDCQKKALPKKAMQVLRRLLVDDKIDILDVFELALQTALQRVVVKRAPFSPPLGDEKPHHLIEGKTCRYDVYLTR